MSTLEDPRTIHTIHDARHAAGCERCLTAVRLGFGSPEAVNAARLAQTGDCPSAYPDTCPNVDACPVHDDGSLFSDRA